jgi:hypothetical protein
MKMRLKDTENERSIKRRAMETGMFNSFLMNNVIEHHTLISLTINK